MKREVLAFGLALLVMATSAAPALAEESCSEATARAALNKLEAREKLARDGLKMWQQGLEELRKNARGASYLTAAVKAVPLIPLIKLGAAAFLLGMDFTVIGTVAADVAFAFNAGKEALAPHWDREKTPLYQTFRQFDSARAKARAKVKPRDSLLGAAAYSRDLHEEALTMTDLYRQELKFIKDIKPEIVSLLGQDGCARLSHALATREAAKVPLDAYQELTATQSPQPVAAVPAKH